MPRNARTRDGLHGVKYVFSKRWKEKVIGLPTRCSVLRKSRALTFRSRSLRAYQERVRRASN